MRCVGSARHGTARAAPARPHRLHRARPRRGAHGSSSTCSAASTSTHSAPSRTTTATGWTDHLGVHPRARWSRTASSAAASRPSSRCSTTPPPTSATRCPRNSDVGGHHIALYVDDLDAAVDHLRSRRGRGARRARPPAGARHEGNRWIYFLSPWGMQFELVSYPGRQGVRPGAADQVRRRHERLSASTTSVDGRGSEPRSPTTSATRSSAASCGPATGSARRRSPSGSAPAGCPCARRCGCWRPRDSPSTRPAQGRAGPAPHPARGRRDLPDARAARTARAHARASPHLAADDLAPPRGGAAPDRGQRRRRSLPRARPRVPPAHLLRLPRSTR